MFREIASSDKTLLANSSKFGIVVFGITVVNRENVETA
jgi:hypothetical protein